MKYLDENGNPITKAEAERRIIEADYSNTKGVKIIDDNGFIQTALGAQKHPHALTPQQIKLEETLIHIARVLVGIIVILSIIFIISIFR